MPDQSTSFPGQPPVQPVTASVAPTQPASSATVPQPQAAAIPVAASQPQVAVPQPQAFTPQPGDVSQASPQVAAASQRFPVLQCENLGKRYGSHVALANVDLTIPAGRIVGLLGPNGSGKTTLMKLAAGLLTPSQGSIRIQGHEPGVYTKAVVSYLPERPYFAPSMKVVTCMDMFADFYRDFDRAAAADMLARLGVAQSQPFSALSKGTKEKVQLVLVMARNAALYLLDEPIGGVDPAARDFILDTVISNYRRDASILISTHLVADVERVLDDFVFIQNGVVTMYAPASYAKECGYEGIDGLFRKEFRC